MEKIKEIKVQKSFRLKESSIKMLNRIAGKDDTERVEFCIEKTFNFLHKEEIEFPFCLEIEGYKANDPKNLLLMEEEQLKELDLYNYGNRNGVKEFDLVACPIFDIENKGIGFNLLEQFGLEASKNIQREIQGIKREKICLGITEEVALKLRKEFGFFENSKTQKIYNYGPLSEEFIKIDKTETDTLVFTPDKEKILELVLRSVIIDNVLVKDIEDNIRLEKMGIIKELKEKAIEIDKEINTAIQEERKVYNQECLDYLHILDESCSNRENRIAYLLKNIKDEQVLQEISKEYFSYYRIKEILSNKQTYCMDRKTYNFCNLITHNLNSLSMNELKAYDDVIKHLEGDKTIYKYFEFRVVTGFKETDCIQFNNNTYDKEINKRWFNEGDKYLIVKSLIDEGELVQLIRLNNWFLDENKEE